MEENKQVRVDNWGVFFLQRLQLFFNKTDFCDLTLQFQGNVQLKVHRLVLNACTEYFEVLERSDRLIDDNVILMPDSLQPDVVVPIINFMYTGMLEYPQSIYSRLCQAADLMHISVLTKLLDAQKPTQSTNKTERVVRPKIKDNRSESFSSYAQVKKAAPKITPILSDYPSPTFPSKKVTGWKRKATMSSNSSFSSRSDSMHRSSDILASDEAKPTRFEWPEDDMELPGIDSMDTSGFGDISYNSKPLLREDEVKPILSKSENAKQTSKDSIHEIHFDDKSNHETNRNGVEKRKADTMLDNKSPKRIRIVETEKDTTISVMANENSSNFDPTKIVSEILKKYPHLVKKKKNIKLKIVAKSSEKDFSKVQSSVDKTPIEKTPVKSVIKKTTVGKAELTLPSKNTVWTCKDCVSSLGEPMEFMLYYLYRKHMTDIHNMKFDPRICKYCGIEFTRMELHSYHIFTKHGMKPLAGHVFPNCSVCPYIALSKEALQIHEKKHKKTEMQCSTCKLAFISTEAISAHIQITNHMGKNKKNIYDCQYCTRTSQSSICLLSHIKSNHEAEGKRDGIVSLDEVDPEDDVLSELVQEHEPLEEYVPETQKNKVKIISDVTVPVCKTESAESVTLSQTKSQVSVPTSIATSLGLLDIVVLDENQQFILHNQAEATGNSRTEYILPQMDARNVTAEGLPTNDELVMVLTDQDYKDGHTGINTDNSNIVVLYSHPADGQQGQFITSQGNLMVNSETGLLEIRNGAAIATTSANQIVMSTPADNHIETIEMIQREIEEGQDMKQDTFYDNEKPKMSEQSQETVHYIENTQVDVGNQQVIHKEVTENAVMHVQEVEKSDAEETIVNEEPSVSAAEIMNDSVEESVCNTSSISEIEATNNAEPIEESLQADILASCEEESKDIVTMEIEDSGLVEEAQRVIDEDVSITNDIQQTLPADSIENVIGEVDKKEEIEPENIQNPANVISKELSDGEKECPMEIDETPAQSEELTEERSTNKEDEDDETSKLLNAEVIENLEEKSPSLPLAKEGEEEEKPYSPTDNPIDMDFEVKSEPSEKQDTDSLTENSIEISQCEREMDNQEVMTSTQSSQIPEEDADDKQSIGTKESTTMSILDDWEDTDSQQSDNKMKLMKKGAQETVHKLMDDWDEDEIDK